MKRSIAFFLQTNHVIHCTIPVAQYARDAGYAIIDRAVSKDLDIMNCGEDLSQYDLVIHYGSTKLNTMFRATPLGDYIVDDERGYSADYWIEKFGNLALNHDGREMLAGDVSDYLKSQGAAHVRPTSEHKALIARVFDVSSWAEHRQEREISDALEVFVSTPKVIEYEYRCWVVDGKVIEVSQYISNGSIAVELIEDPAIHAQAQALANIYVPSEAVVMDMAKTPDGYRFIEFNIFNSSGWYAGRVKLVMDAYIDHYRGRLQA